MIQTSIQDMPPQAGKLPAPVIASPDGGQKADFAAIFGAETGTSQDVAKAVLHADMMPANVSLAPVLPAAMSRLSGAGSDDVDAGLDAMLVDVGGSVQDAATDLDATAIAGDALSLDTASDPALPVAMEPEQAMMSGDVTLPEIEIVAPEEVPAPGTELLAAAGSGPAEGQDPTPVLRDNDMQMIDPQANEQTADQTAKQVAEQTAEQVDALWPDVLVNLSAMPGQTPAVARRPVPVSDAVPTPTAPSQPAVAGSEAETLSQNFAELSKNVSEFRVRIETATAQAAASQAAGGDVQALASETAPQFQPLQAAPDAPRPMTAPPPQVPVSTARPEWPETFVQSVQGLPMKDGEKLTIALTPERLGAVQVRMEIVDGVANVAIVTETPEAARLFVEQQQRLADLLARNGIEMGGQSVSSSADGNGNGSGRRDAGHTGQIGDAGEGDETLAFDETQTNSSLTDAVRRRGLVDLTA